MSVPLTVDRRYRSWAGMPMGTGVPTCTQGYVAAFFLFTLGCILPLVLLDSLRHWEYDLSVLIASVVTFYSAGRLAAFAAREDRRMLQLTFWIFVYVFLGLTPLLQIASRTFPYAIFYPRAETFRAEVIVVLGLFGYELGYASGFSCHWPAVRKLHRLLSSYSVSQPRLMMFSVGAVLVSLAIAFSTGGVAVLLQPREQMITDFRGSVGGEGLANLELFRNLMQLSPAVATYISWVCITQRRRLENAVGIGTYAMFLLVLSVAVLTCNPLNGSRYMFATFTVAALFAKTRWRPRFCGTWVVVLVAGLVWIYPAVGELRGTVGELRGSKSGTLLSGLGSAAVSERMTTSYDFDGFRSIIDGVTYVQDNGVAWGRQFVGVLMFWYPREYWPDKPEPTAQMVSRHVGYSFTNISAPLWEDAYVDWGMPGVLIMLFLYGWGSAILDAWREARPTDTSLGAIVIAYLASYEFFTLRGDLWAAVSYLVPVLLLFALTFQHNTRTRMDGLTNGLDQTAK